MKIVVIGAEGDVGQAAVQELSVRHDVITAGRTSGDVRVDIGDRTSIDAMYQTLGSLDAVVCTAGNVHFDVLTEFTQDQFMLGLENKVMGQINLVLAGLDRVNAGGSFTLTSGILDQDPIRMGAGAATANGALAGFVKGAAIEMPRDLRLNAVSPGLLDVSVPRYGEWFPGHDPVPAAQVGLAFAKAVEGPATGQVIQVH